MPLWNDIVYGPIHSRRLGRSLGVNLLPITSKICSFNCVYCECGWNRVEKVGAFPTVEQYEHALEAKLKELAGAIDVITFAGNGEPTLHPQFYEIIDSTIRLRDTYAPSAKISVLSNATQLQKEQVASALRKVDNNILKLDSAITSTLLQINQPGDKSFTAERLVENLVQFQENCIIQTLFFKGEYNGVKFDNTTDEEVAAWLKALQQIRPQEVMVYSLDRATPVENLQRPSADKLREIASRVESLGIKTSVTI